VRRLVPRFRIPSTQFPQHHTVWHLNPNVMRALSCYYVNADGGVSPWRCNRLR